ncbi:MAG: response regulator [Oscillospiraceae bacterium]|nr:response regulator [Oscillospiraceae bacterium]
MYWYALIGVLATAVLIIQNYDILFSRSDRPTFPEIGTYRKFLYGIMAYYVTDILWGLLDSLGLTTLLYWNTVVYYVAMAVGVRLWTQFVVEYLGEKDVFSRFLYRSGQFIFLAVVLITVINCFTPVLFWFDSEGRYHASLARHIQLAFQIMLLLLTSVYTLRAIPRAEGASRKRYRTIFFFGLVVATLLLVQLPYPFLPLYTIGYMLGSCLLHTFVVSNEMDELLQRQSELAIAANKAKTAFLSHMSHEIRTPISSVLGMNEMVLRESSEPQVLTYAENIRASGSTLLGLVNDILDFSKIEAGKLEVIPVDYDLSSVINDLVNMIRTRAEAKGLQLNLDFNPGTPKLLRGDEIRLKQIITNILTNAVKYTEKGSVTFSLDYDPAPDSDDDVILAVSVSDTGIGIRPEDMDRLFSEFDRLEEKRNRRIEGTGLGMAITRRLLEMMGSSLSVRSVYGEGSVFSFRLRQRVLGREGLGNYAESCRAAVHQPRKYRAKFIAPEATVLMADDNPMNILVFRGLLKETGLQIDTAESGDECLALTEKRKYDLIFLDHMMPVKDGIETLHELRARPRNPNHDTPVICVTANAVSGAREQYIREGFDDYLTKPFDTSRLEETIMNWLPKETVREATALNADELLSPQNIPGVFSPLLSRNNFNLSAGIRNSGDPESYLTLLRLFYESLDRNASEIGELFAAADWKNYAIRIHALKSSARLIGAETLGEKAQILETASRGGDAETVRSHHGDFMTEYLSLRTPLSEIFPEPRPEDRDLPLADPETLFRLREQIRAAAEEMDIDALESFLSGLSRFHIPESEESLWTGIREAVSRYDYDAVLTLLTEETPVAP